MPRRIHISPILILSVGMATLSLGACMSNSDATSGARVSIAEAQAAAARCGLAGRVDFQLVGERRLHIARLDPNAEYTEVDCLLSELRQSDVNLGIVGNEAPSAEAFADDDTMGRVQAAARRCGLPGGAIVSGLGDSTRRESFVVQASAFDEESGSAGPAFVCFVNWAQANGVRIGFVSEPPAGNE